MNNNPQHQVAWTTHDNFNPNFDVMLHLRVVHLASWGCPLRTREVKITILSELIWKIAQGLQKTNCVLSHICVYPECSYI